MHLAILAFGVFALAACATVTTPAERAAGPYAALPSAPDPEPPARPITARLLYRARGADAELDAFLDRLTAAMERRNWRAVALFLDEEAFAAQTEFLTGTGRTAGQAAAEALEGALGLGADSSGSSPNGSSPNGVFPAGADRAGRPFLGLDRIRTASIRGYGLGIETGVFRVTGDVLLDDRTRRDLELFVRRTPRGYRLVVPVG